MIRPPNAKVIGARFGSLRSYHHDMVAPPPIRDQRAAQVLGRCENRKIRLSFPKNVEKRDIANGVRHEYSSLPFHRVFSTIRRCVASQEAK
jgi:hypothetical protein